MAGSLESVLARIPGIAGYHAKKQMNEREDAQAQASQMGQLQQMGALQGILAKVQAAKQQEQFRAGMSNATTDDERMSLAANALGPEGLMKHFDTRAKTDQTKQIAMQTLQQKIATESRHAYEFAQTLPIKQRDIALKEIQAQATNLWHAGSLAIQKGNLDYNVGGNTSGIGDIISRLRTQAPAAPDGASAAQGAFPAGQPTSAERAAMAQLRPLAQGGGSVEVMPQAAPQVAPQAPQMAPQAMPDTAPWSPARPNNLDARDLGAMATGPVMGTTPVSAPVAPQQAPVAPAAAQMPQFSGSPREQTAARNKWLMDQGKTSIAGAGKLTPEALTDVAAQYLAGDRQAISGFARDQATKSAIQNEISKQMRVKGWTGPDVAAQMADFAGIMSGSRTVGTRAAQIELASSEADKMIDIARNRSKAFERTQFVPVNVALRAYETNTGQPEVKAFGAAINSLVNVYARAISPSGVPTVSDKDHAREMLASVDSVPQFLAVTDVMREEMKAAREAPGDVRAATRRAIRGVPPPTGGFDADKEKRYQEWKARQPK